MIPITVNDGDDYTLHLSGTVTDENGASLTVSHAVRIRSDYGLGVG